MQPLCSLAVTVFNSTDKAYRWRVVELAPETARDLRLTSSSRHGRPTALPWPAGLMQLQGLIENLAVGPREEAQAPTSKRKRGLFGFGFGFGVPRA